MLFKISFYKCHQLKNKIDFKLPSALFSIRRLAISKFPFETAAHKGVTFNLN